MKKSDFIKYLQESDLIFSIHGIENDLKVHMKLDAFKNRYKSFTVEFLDDELKYKCSTTENGIPIFAFGDLINISCDGFWN